MVVFAAQRTESSTAVQPSWLTSSLPPSAPRGPIAPLARIASYAVPSDLRVGLRLASSTASFGVAVLPVPTGRKRLLARAHSGYLMIMSWISGGSGDQHASPAAPPGLARLPGSNDG